MTTVREDYKSLMGDFADGRISAPEFETAFLEKFKGETRPLDEWTYRLLDQVFAAVDAFCGDEVLLKALKSEAPDQHLSAEELRERVEEALQRLGR